MSAEARRIRWSQADIEGIRGKHAVVTGGNSGLGFETVKALAQHGATVTLACRSIDRGRAARDAIAAACGPVEIDVRELDLASLVSIRDFTAALSTSPIDMLINNAGVMAVPLSRTVDGFEMQFGTNHLGHFALAGFLLEGLQKSIAARVVTVSSNMHKVGRINFDNLNAELGYAKWAAYGQSKLANLLFTYELQRRLVAHGINNVTAYAAHPGYSATNLSAPTVAGRGSFVAAGRLRMEAVIAQPASMGCLPQLFAATEASVPAGAYIGPDGWGEWRGHPKLSTPTAAARDAEVAARLWSVSEELTSVRYLDN